MLEIQIAVFENAEITNRLLVGNRWEMARLEVQKFECGGADQNPRCRVECQNPNLNATHYGLAWSYLHFLIHRDGGKHKEGRLQVPQGDERLRRQTRPPVYKEATRKDLSEIEKGWADYVLTLQAPPEAERQVLIPKNAGPDEDVKKDDLLDRINGHPIYSEADWEKHWVNRDKKLPVKLLLIRQYGRKGPMDYFAEVRHGDREARQQARAGRRGHVAFVRNVVQ